MEYLFKKEVINPMKEYNNNDLFLSLDNEDSVVKPQNNYFEEFFGNQSTENSTENSTEISNDNSEYLQVQIPYQSYLNQKEHQKFDYLSPSTKQKQEEKLFQKKKETDKKTCYNQKDKKRSQIKTVNLNKKTLLKIQKEQKEKTEINSKPEKEIKINSPEFQKLNKKQKKAWVAQRNREAAQKSRDRKKQKWIDIQKELTDLRNENDQLKKQNELYVKQNKELYEGSFTKDSLYKIFKCCKCETINIVNKAQNVLNEYSKLSQIPKERLQYIKTKQSNFNFSHGLITLLATILLIQGSKIKPSSNDQERILSQVAPEIKFESYQDNVNAAIEIPQLSFENKLNFQNQVEIEDIDNETLSEESIINNLQSKIQEENLSKEKKSQKDSQKTINVNQMFAQIIYPQVKPFIKSIQISNNDEHISEDQCEIENKSFLPSISDTNKEYDSLFCPMAFQYRQKDKQQKDKLVNNQIIQLLMPKKYISSYTQNGDKIDFNVNNQDDTMLEVLCQVKNVKEHQMNNLHNINQLV